MNNAKLIIPPKQLLRAREIYLMDEKRSSF